jgi:hypothetical protein
MPPGDDNDDEWEEDDFGDFSSPPAVEKAPPAEGANGEAAGAEDHLFGEDFATSDDGGESQASSTDGRAPVVVEEHLADVVASEDTGGLEDLLAAGNTWEETPIADHPAPAASPPDDGGDAAQTPAPGDDVAFSQPTSDAIACTDAPPSVVLDDLWNGGTPAETTAVVPVAKDTTTTEEDLLGGGFGAAEPVPIPVESTSGGMEDFGSLHHPVPLSIAPVASRDQGSAVAEKEDVGLVASPLVAETGDAVHMDALGDLNEAMDAPPVDTVAVEDESFGEFDEAQAIQTPAPTAAVEVESVTEEGVTEEDDFGEFDEAPPETIPDPMAASAVEDNDVFGNAGEATMPAVSAQATVSSDAAPTDANDVLTGSGVAEVASKPLEIPVTGIAANDVDDFGDFGGTEHPSTSPLGELPAQSTDDEGDDFGDFGEPGIVSSQLETPAVTATVDATSEGFGGGEDALPPLDTPAVVAAVNGVDDDVGDIGGGESVLPPLGTPTLAGEVDDDDFGDFGVAEQPPAPSVGVALTDNAGEDEGDVGDFGGTEFVQSSPGETPVMAIEDEEDFGDFGEAEVAPLPPAETPSSTVENDDDFGDFGEAEQLPASPLAAVPAGSATDAAEDDEEDDFGDFGGAEGEASPEETAAAAIDDDDDFGDFGEAQEAPAAIATTPPPTSSPLVSSDPVFAPVAAAMYRMFQPSSVDDSAESEDVATVEQAEVLSISDVMVRRTMLYLRPPYIICSPFSSGIHAIRNARLGERRRADFHLGFAPKERFASERRITKECCWKASIPYIIPVTWLYKLAPAKEACRGPAGCGSGRIGCQIGGESSRSHPASGNRKHCGANAASYQQ